MDKSTGSPPDLFDPNGQNWGFPTYNWDAMAEEDFKWCGGQRVLGRPWPLE
jgi:4-alpha-glucanotransferase